MSRNPTSYVFGGQPYVGKPFDPMAVTLEPMSIGPALRTVSGAMTLHRIRDALRQSGGLTDGERIDAALAIIRETLGE